MTVVVEKLVSLYTYLSDNTTEDYFWYLVLRQCTQTRQENMRIPVVLVSRWGLEPVVVIPGSSSDDGKWLVPLEETNDTNKQCTKPAAPMRAPAPVVAAAAVPAPASPAACGSRSISCACGDDGRNVAGKDEDEDDIDDDEPTGSTLWDCAQVLWDLVADPNPANTYSVKGKVPHVIISYGMYCCCRIRALLLLVPVLLLFF